MRLAGENKGKGKEEREREREREREKERERKREREKEKRREKKKREEEKERERERRRKREKEKKREGKKEGREKKKKREGEKRRERKKKRREKKKGKRIQPLAPAGGARLPAGASTEWPPVGNVPQERNGECHRATKEWGGARKTWFFRFLIFLIFCDFWGRPRPDQAQPYVLKIFFAKIRNFDFLKF